jgi:hypothetical protein
MDVEERLAQIDRKQDRTCIMLEQLTAKVDERIEAADHWRDRVERTVWGLNGGADHSLVVRLDRLEQAHRQGTWVLRIVVGVFITGIAGGLWALLTG